MSRRAKIWLLVAALFFVINLGGTVVAALAREPIHAGIHAGLTILTIVAVVVLRRRSPATTGYRVSSGS
jgi:hypothetical protein